MTKDRFHACQNNGFGAYYTWPEFWHHRLSGECSKPISSETRQAMQEASLNWEKTGENPKV